MKSLYQIDKDEAVVIFSQAVDLYNEWESYLKTLNAKSVLLNFKKTSKDVKELGQKTIEFISLVKEMNEVKQEQINGKKGINRD